MQGFLRFIVLLTLLTTHSVFASPSKDLSHNNPEIYFELSHPEILPLLKSKRLLTITVNPTTNGKRSDPILVVCNSGSFYVRAGQSINCPLYNNSGMLSLLKAGFENGTSGVVTFL